MHIAGFTVYYTPTTTEPAKNLLYTFSIGTVRWLKQAAATTSLSYAPGAFRTLLFPTTPTTTAAGALGIIVGSFTAPNSTGQYQFRVACKRCMLLVNEQMLVDNWESAAVSGGATKQSGCVSLLPGSSNTLSVRFATPELKDAPMSVQWAACGSGSPKWAPVSSASSTLWWPSQGLTGEVLHGSVSRHENESACCSYHSFEWWYTDLLACYQCMPWQQRSLGIVLQDAKAPQQPSHMMSHAMKHGLQVMLVACSAMHGRAQTSLGLWPLRPPTKCACLPRRLAAWRRSMAPVLRRSTSHWM